MKVGRNQPCHCGSGRRYKHCCLEKDQAKEHAAIDIAARRSENPFVASGVSAFNQAIDRVRKYNPRKIR
jgi:hypothetical protein